MPNINESTTQIGKKKYILGLKLLPSNTFNMVKQLFKSELVWFFVLFLYLFVDFFFNLLADQEFIRHFRNFWDMASTLVTLYLNQEDYCLH